MEIESLIVGIVFSMGVFAVKTGLGMHYYVHRNADSKNRMRFLGVFGLVYGGLFAASALFLKQIDLAAHFESLQAFLKSGMLVHFIMAFLMSFWGIRLLRQTAAKTPKSRVWLMLVIPCPVCMTVILFNVGFLMAYFPDGGMMAVACACAGFLGISMLSGFAIGRLNRKAKASLESLLGSGMLLIAAYFCLSVFIMPQFADVDKIYRLAAYRGGGHSPPSVKPATVYLVSAATLAAGFLTTRFKIRKITHWIQPHC